MCENKIFTNINNWYNYKKDPPKSSNTILYNFICSLSDNSIKYYIGYINNNLYVNICILNLDKSIDLLRKYSNDTPYYHLIPHSPHNFVSCFYSPYYYKNMIISKSYIKCLDRKSMLSLFDNFSESVYSYKTNYSEVYNKIKLETKLKLVL